MKAIANPHDRFFKELLSRPELLRSFVETYLDPAVVAELDLDSLELDKDSFVDTELREHLSDLVCRTRLHDGRPCIVYLMFEHKSFPDELAPLQLSRYVVRQWEKHVKTAAKATAQAEAENRRDSSDADADADEADTDASNADADAEPDTVNPGAAIGAEGTGPATATSAPAVVFRPPSALPLPLIVPVIFYHGRRPWKVPDDLAGLVSSPPALARYVPHLCYNLVDLSCYDDAQIKGAALLCAGLLTLKHIWSEDLGQRLPGILGLVKDVASSGDGLWAVEALIRYLASGSSYLATVELSEAIHGAFSDVGGQAMPTIADQWFREGELSGEQRGRETGRESVKLELARKLLDRGMPPAEVATLVELPLDRVLELAH